MVNKSRIGEENINKIGSTMIITEYRGSQDMDVYFPEYDWTFTNSQYSAFKRGEIICPYERRFFNKGYMGEGPHTMRVNGERNKIYTTWHGMLQRCYSNNCHARQPYYINCEVCDEWLNFQTFGEWYKENYYEIKGHIMALDKDILIKGNKLYSPETCVFVPKAINSLFVKSDKTRGELPIGITKTPSNKYHAAIRMTSLSGKRKITSLGNYNTPEEAFIVYKRAKENYIKEVADLYKDQIPQRLYDAMCNYEIEYDD